MATMSQAIKEAFGESGDALPREAIKQSVESRYPEKWQPATLSAHLYACAINNARAYVHHPHSERFLYKRADGTFELYDEKAHGPNLWAPDEAENVWAEQAGEASITLERDIEDQLVHQLVVCPLNKLTLDLRGVSTVRAGIAVRRPVRPRASNRKIISGTYH